MKILTTVIVITILSVHMLAAQGSRPAAMGFGGGQPGPGLSGSTAKLFGENKSFSAQLEMQTGNSPDAMTIPGKIYFDEGKSRFEMDMSQLKGGMMSPQMAEQMKSIGMDKTVVISRPDKKLAYQIYPGMQAYLETQLQDKEAETPTSDFKVETSEVGKETIDGHPCIKNKAVVTEKSGTQHESLVWNATDLKNFPLKIEQSEGAMKTTMLFRQVSLSKPASTVFDPPSGSTKYDNMQSMMQQVIMKRMAAPPAGAPGQGQ